MTPSKNRLTAGVILILAGWLGAVLGPMFSMMRTFSNIESMQNPRPEDLRVGIYSALLWGLPGILMLLAGIYLLILAVRRRN